MMAKQKKMTTHKKVRQDGRPNGKSYKQHIRKFDPDKRKLVCIDCG